MCYCFFFFSSRRRHTRCSRDWSSDVCSSDLGPWRFVAWQHDDYLLFARNPRYWEGPPAADTLAVRIIPEPLTRAAEFEAGRLSVVEVPFGETARWRRAPPAWLLEKPALRVGYVALNNPRGPPRGGPRRPAVKAPG